MSRMPRNEALSLLGLEEGATDDEVNRAFRRSSLACHPDKNLHNKDNARIQFQNYVNARDSLLQSQQFLHCDIDLQTENPLAVYLCSGDELSRGELLELLSVLDRKHCSSEAAIVHGQEKSGEAGSLDASPIDPAVCIWNKREEILKAFRASSSVASKDDLSNILRQLSTLERPTKNKRNRRNRKKNKSSKKGGKISKNVYPENVDLSESGSRCVQAHGKKKSTSRQRRQARNMEDSGRKPEGKSPE